MSPTPSKTLTEFERNTLILIADHWHDRLDERGMRYSRHNPVANAIYYRLWHIQHCLAHNIHPRNSCLTTPPLPEATLWRLDHPCACNS
jgi:hypothetical protein